MPLIAGVGDGRFLPDREISLAEAVTILLRALDYTGKEAGSVWPQGYLNLAKSIGLTDGLNGKAASYLTRGEAAQLLSQNVFMLLPNTKNPYKQLYVNN